ncbi:hypothetical protein HRG84_24270 [Flavisolibacter sp. BT320]|nr:hypothetical protein [Flavisolibacter longurius]
MNVSVYIFFALAVLSCKNVEDGKKTELNNSGKDSAILAKFGGRWVYRNGRAVSIFEVSDSFHATLIHSMERKFRGSIKINDSLWRRKDTVNLKFYDWDKLVVGDSTANRKFILLNDTLKQIDTPKHGWLRVDMVRETVN